ncbi:TPA: UDP glucuronosyltransferase 2, polypeptide A3 [Trebouxia sp. C0006]
MSLAPRNMTFVQRVNNMVAFVMNMYCWQYVIEPQMDKVFWRQYDIPPYSYFKSNRQAPLVLVPIDWAITNAEPLAPHMVAIGAITAAPAKALPSELEEFMQSAGDHGVVYASLGTTAIPEVAELKEIATGLSALAPTKALWKLSDSDLVAVGNESISAGSNVKIVKWVNQNDVLGHPNVKVFLTQGGTNSFNEAAYHGVPLVGMPLFAEQPDNIARAADRGFALSVSVKKLDTLAKDLEQAIKRILKEPGFAISAAKVSHLMKAHRESPAQLAASAIEHAAWTRGERHMQPLRDDLNWFQTNSLDVMFLFTVLVLTLLTMTTAALVAVAKGLMLLLRRNSIWLHAKTV